MALGQYVAGMGALPNVGLGIDHAMAHTCPALDTPHGVAWIFCGCAMEFNKPVAAERLAESLWRARWASNDLRA